MGAGIDSDDRGRRRRPGGPGAGSRPLPGVGGEGGPEPEGLPRHYRVRSLEQALSLLDALGDGGELTLPELGERVGAPTPVAHKLVLHLQRAGLIEANPATGRYRLGAARLSELAARALAGLNPWDEVRPVVSALLESTGMPGLVAVLRGSRCVYVEQFRGPDRALGRAFPAHATALGKALLAHLPDDQLRAVLPETALVRWGPRTIGDPAALQADLDEVRRRGWALEDEELDSGRRSIGAPVFDSTGEVVAAIGVGGHLEELPDERLQALAGAVTAEAARLSAALGARETAEPPGRRLEVEVLGVLEPPLVPPGDAPDEGRGRRRRPGRGAVRGG